MMQNNLTIQRIVCLRLRHDDTVYLLGIAFCFVGLPGSISTAATTDT